MCFPLFVPPIPCTHTHLLPPYTPLSPLCDVLLPSILRTTFCCCDKNVAWACLRWQIKPVIEPTAQNNEYPASLSLSLLLSVSLSFAASATNKHGRGVRESRQNDDFRNFALVTSEVTDGRMIDWSLASFSHSIKPNRWTTLMSWGAFVAQEGTSFQHDSARYCGCVHGMKCCMTP